MADLTNGQLGWRRAAEMAAVFMIGDGLLGLTQPVRHVTLWRSEVRAVDALVRPFAGRPGLRRGYGAVQMAAGLALAAALRRSRKNGAAEWPPRRGSGRVPA